MSSAFKMIDVGNKPITHRVAVARGEIHLSARVRLAIEEKKIPKGDVLALAEVAGISAAKRTSDILPLCHPLALDAVEVRCEVDSAGNRVLVICQVSTHARTGVEMEALSGVSAALLCIYDLTKGLDKGAVISGIRLEHKQGGKSGTWWHADHTPAAQSTAPALSGLRAAVITVSDRCARGERADESGGILASYLRNCGASLDNSKIVPDEVDQIRQAVQDATEVRELDLLLLTGGTGLGPRDVTPDALHPLWTKTLPGFGELFRSRGLLSTPHAWLSRADAGLVRHTLVVLLPGSPSGVRDGLSVIDQMIPHMISMIRGGTH